MGQEKGNKTADLFTKDNFKRLVLELIYLYSHKKSFFSKKRIESGIAFGVMEFGAIYFLITKIEVMTASDFAIWGATQAALCGYTIHQIQKEKKETDNV